MDFIGIRAHGSDFKSVNLKLVYKERNEILVIVQDKDSSVVFGMPAAALALGVDAEVMSPGMITMNLLALTGTRQ